MIDIIIYSTTFALTALALFSLVKLRDKSFLLAFGTTFAVYLGLDDFLTAIGGKSQYALISGNWNWSGKIYSIFLSALLIFSLRIDPKASGLVLPYKNNKSSIIVTILLITLSTALGFIFKPSSPDMETLIYQATMPGLAEELTYRGIAPAIFLGWIYRKHEPSRSYWPALVVTAIMFSLWHGLGFKSGSYSFDIASASFTLVGGLAYGWLRFRSGSLLYPVIAHCLGNFTFQLVALVGT